MQRKNNRLQNVWNFWIGLMCGVLLVQCGTPEEKITLRPEGMAFRYVQSYEFAGYQINIRDWGIDGSASLGQCQIEVRDPRGESSFKEFDFDGQVAGSWVRDLDRDGQIEVYVWAKSAGSGSYGSMIGVEYIEPELIERPLPVMTDAMKDGYMGHDRFEIVNNQIVRTYPLYREGDPNANPSGGTRQVTYMLVNNQWDVRWMDRAR